MLITRTVWLFLYELIVRAPIVFRGHMKSLDFWKLPFKKASNLLLSFTEVYHTNMKDCAQGQLLASTACLHD